MNVSHDKIILKDLFFDPQNPRLPEKKRSSDESYILQWMLKEANIPELMMSIAATGFSSAEPLLVTKSENGQYIVVEGNRRLAALKLLASPEKAHLRAKTVLEITTTAKHSISKETRIPVIVYEQRTDVLDYLGFRHITGVKPWGPRQKAEYLKQLFEAHREDNPEKTTLSFVSKLIGTKPYYAKKLLITLNIAEFAENEAFWKSPNLEDKLHTNFSVLHTALAYENISKYVNIESSKDWDKQEFEKEHVKDILEWTCGLEKIISDSRELKRLNAVIGNETSLKKLKEGMALDMAASFTGEAREDLLNFLQEAYKKLTEVDRLISRVDAFTQSDVDEAREVSVLARKIHSSIRDFYDDANDD